MSLVQSLTAVGVNPVPTSGCAGAVVVQRATFPVSAALAVGDLVELGILPAFNYLVSARLVNTTGNGDTDAALQILSGVAGQKTNPDGSARTGTAIADANGLLDSAFLLQQQDYDQGIAVSVGTAVAAGGTGALLLVLEYAQG